MNFVRGAQKWLLKTLANLLLDLICTLFEPFDETEGVRASTIGELAKALIDGEEESACIQSTHSIDKAAPQIDWFFSDQCNWSRGNNG